LFRQFMFFLIESMIDFAADIGSNVLGVCQCVHLILMIEDNCPYVNVEIYIPLPDTPYAVYITG